MYGSSHGTKQVSFVQWALDVLEFRSKRPVGLIFVATDLISRPLTRCGC